MKRIFILMTVLLLGLKTFAESDAVITWLNFSDTTTYKSLNLKYGITAKSKIEDFDVIVNNQEIKGLNAVVADGYDMVRTKSVVLKDGPNIIEAIVKTASGITKSTKTIVKKTSLNPIVISIDEEDEEDDIDFDELYIDALVGDPYSQYLLGRMYLKGCSEVDKDMFESSLWFRESAMAANHDGEYEYACALMDGRGILKNVQLGIRYLKLASEGKQPKALLRLGICYETGVGVNKDITKAKELYSKCPLQEAKQRLNNLNKKK